jgi:putative oxidoreductase
MIAWFHFAALPFIARLCLVILFPFSGVDKIMHWDDAMKQATSTPVPFPALLLALGTLVELVTPICIVFIWHARFAAFILAGFCAVTAILYHQFWKFGNFWDPDDLIGRSHLWDFLKNFGLVGGLLLIVINGPLL